MSDRSHPSLTAGGPLGVGRGVVTLVAITAALSLTLLLCFGEQAGLDPSAAAATTTTAATPAHEASSHPTSSGTTPGSTQVATVQFNVCPGSDCSGIEVYVDTAACCFQPSSKYSLCTKDEGFDGRVNTYTRFSPKVNGEVHRIEMFAKAGYPGESCASERSYNTWIIKVSRNNKQIMRGVVWLGEDVPVLAEYYAACGKYSPWDPAFENMTCTTTGTKSLTLSTPGALPPPNCSQSDSAAAFCRIQLHLDAEPLKSPPFTPCLPSNSFNNAFGICAGSSEGTNGWTTPKASIGDGIFTALAWCDLGICTYKGERIRALCGAGGAVRPARTDRADRGHRPLRREQSVQGGLGQAVAHGSEPEVVLGNGKLWTSGHRGRSPAVELPGRPAGFGRVPRRLPRAKDDVVYTTGPRSSRSADPTSHDRARAGDDVGRRPPLHSLFDLIQP